VPDENNRSAFSSMLPEPVASEDTAKILRKKRKKVRAQNVSKLFTSIKAIAYVLIFASLLYLAVIQLKYLFFSTSYFEIKQVKTAGLKHLEENEVLKLANIPPSTKIFALDTEKTKQNLLKHPRIQNAEVQLEGLYNVKLQITEREPVIYAKNGIAFYEIAPDGIIISTEGMGEKDLPIITGLDLKNAQQGDSLNGNDDFYMAMSWVNFLGQEILKNISELNFSNTQNPYIILLTGEKIYPRDMNDFKIRFNFLRALLDKLKANNVDTFYLDMRAPDIVVRPKISKS